jgi:hypothetical protein
MIKIVILITVYRNALIDSHILFTYDCWHILLLSLQYLSESCFGNDNIFILPNPWVVVFFHLPNLLLTQNFVYPTLFSSVPPPAINNDRSLTLYDITIVGGYSAILLYYPDSLQLRWYIVLTRNNSSWGFSEPEKQVCRFTMASRSKSFIFLHVAEEEERGVMDIWCTNGLRRDSSITRGGLDVDQWCVRLSMRSSTVYGKKICGGAQGSYATNKLSPCISDTTRPLMLWIVHMLICIIHQNQLSIIPTTFCKSTRHHGGESVTGYCVCVHDKPS